MVEHAGTRLLARLDAVEPLALVAGRGRNGVRRRLQVLHRVAFGHDLEHVVVPIHRSVDAVEIDAQPALRLGVAVQVKPVAVRE